MTRIKSPDTSPEDYRARCLVARKLARVVLNSKTLLYSQHLPGKFNIIADSLSRDFEIPANQLSSHLLSLFPTQLAQDFRISPLPPAISCFIGSILSELPKGKRLPKAHTTSEVCLGGNGKNVSKGWDSAIISSLMDMGREKGTSYSPASPTLEAILDEERNRCLQDMSKVPLEIYPRRFATLDIQTQPSTSKEKIS